MLFYDIVKYFDKLIRKDVMKDLGHNGVNVKMYRIIYKLKSNIKIRIKTAFGKTKNVDVMKTAR